ncbi:small VCP/p97-interacting protein [Drosophila miranda]|uniref:small VCP/p97-interacting protein n=1 Tax=Drosophila miranda TaxID=7229 RepID=UPI0007E8354B|nr:small VCP/p97-interacting protein [Drosophila miranda]
MGVCLSCCGNSAEEANLMPSPDERRQQQLDAAEKRRQENESRGIKNPENLRRQQQKALEQERREREADRQGQGQPTLKWQTT